MRMPAGATLILLMLIVGVTPAAAASDTSWILAQEQFNEDEGVVNDADETESENVNQDEGKGPEAETGAGEGETEPAAEETGPVWTYQMVWLSLGLLLLLGLGVARWYYMLVGRRQRHGV